MDGLSRHDKGGEMKTLLGIFFLIAISVSAQDTTNYFGGSRISTYYDTRLLIDAVKWFEPRTTICFSAIDSTNFSITWANNRVEILYGKSTKPSEAVKQFFEWLKDYIKENYFIIKREELLKLLQQ